FVADQTPLYQDSDYFMTFLNQETLVYTGTERIAKMTGFPVVYCHVARKKKRGYYTCTFHTLVEDPSTYAEYEITQLHNRFTEDVIKQEPAYWLWSHKRWKRKRRSAGRKSIPKYRWLYSIGMGNTVSKSFCHRCTTAPTLTSNSY